MRFITLIGSTYRRQLRRYMTTQSTPTASATSSSTKPSGALDAVAFIDLAFLESLAHNYGVQLYGPNYTKKLSLDLAPLLPFLTESISNKFDGRSVEILRTYAYGIREDRSSQNYNSNSNNNTNNSNNNSSSLSNTSNNSEPGRFNFIRAAINERFPVRAFSGSPSSSGIIASISMASDIVHSASIHPTRSIINQINTETTTIADIDNGTPISISKLETNTNTSETNSTSSSSTSSTSSVSNLKPFDIVICISSFRYLPAMVRAAQHGKSVVLATSLPSLPNSSTSSNSTSSSSSNATSTNTVDSNLSIELWNNAPNSIQNLISRIRIEDILPRIIRPANDFRTGAPSLQSIALRIAEAIAKEPNNNGIAGNRLLSLVMDISKDLSRHRLSIKALLLRFPNAFSIEEQSTKYWVKLKPNWRNTLTVDNSNNNGNKNQGRNNSNSEISTKASEIGTANAKKDSDGEINTVDTSSVKSETETTSNETLPNESTITNSASNISTETASAASVKSATETTETNEKPVSKKRTRKTTTTTATSTSTSNTSNTTENNDTLDPIHDIVKEANKVGIISITDENSKKALNRPNLLQIARTCLPTLYRSSMTKADLLTLLQSNIEPIKNSLKERNTTTLNTPATPSSPPTDVNPLETSITVDTAPSVTTELAAN